MAYKCEHFIASRLKIENRPKKKKKIEKSVWLSVSTDAVSTIVVFFDK